MMNAAVWKLYGVPLSQPFRAVAWTLIQNHVRFDVQLTVPGATTKIGSCHETYLSKSRMRTSRIPLLEHTPTGFTVAESPAILSFLCERYGWCSDDDDDDDDDEGGSSSSSSTSSSLYGLPGSRRKATIDSYMHWHHTGTRPLAMLVFPYLRPEANQPMNDDKQRAKTIQLLQTLEEGWFSPLSSSSNNNNDNDSNELFLAGGRYLSIADMLAYEEIVQLTMLGLLQEEMLADQYPKIFAWTNRMKQQPYHEEVHVALATLGNVKNTASSSDLPIAKRLGAATKAGLQALAQVQTGFDDKESASSKL